MGMEMEGLHVDEDDTQRPYVCCAGFVGRRDVVPTFCYVVRRKRKEDKGRYHGKNLLTSPVSLQFGLPAPSLCRLVFTVAVVREPSKRAKMYSFRCYGTECLNVG